MGKNFEVAESTGRRSSVPVLSIITCSSLLPKDASTRGGANKKQAVPARSATLCAAPRHAPREHDPDRVAPWVPRILGYKKPSFVGWIVTPYYAEAQ